MHAGRAFRERGLYLAHAMAQGLGGRYGLPHGAMNALTLAPALRFNEPAVPDAIAALAGVLRARDAASRVEELAGLAGIRRLRDFGVSESDPEGLGAEIAERPGARANPRPASPEAIEALLRSIY